MHLSEPLQVSKSTRAIVTLIEETESEPPKGNVAAILRFLEENRLPESSRRSSEEIEAGIEENRNSWD